MIKNRKAFALIDVLVALIIITIVGVFIGKYIIGILNINKQMDLENKFESIVNYVDNSLQKNENIMSYTVTPRGILSPDTENYNIEGDILSDFYTNNPDVIYFNYEKALYGCYSDSCSADETAPWGKGTTESNKNLFTNIYNFTLYNFNSDFTDKLAKQKMFLQIPAKYIGKYGDIPFIFVIQRYSEYQGYKYPYKIVSIIDLGPEMYRKLKEFFLKEKNDPVKIQHLMAYLFPVTDNGVILRQVIDFDKMKQSDNGGIDLYNIFVEFLGNNPDKVFSRNKKYFKIKIINTNPYVRAIVANTVDQLVTIKHNVEDWAVIQARIAAYDSLNGNSMDKDYFITCTNSGCDNIDKTRTLKPKLDDDAVICNSLAQDCPDTDVDEMDIGNGFFVCKNENIVQDSSNQHFRGYYCQNSDDDYPSVINQNCEDVFNNPNNINDKLIDVSSAVRLDYPTNVDGNKCLLGEAARKLLSSTNFTANVFKIPVYFSNGTSINIESETDNLLNSNDDTLNNVSYTIQLNVPVNDNNVVNNPPYNAEIFTVFPWFLGGIEKNGLNYYDRYAINYQNSENGEKYYGFGIVEFPIFAHIF